MTPVLTTLVYCLQNGKVLLIKRHKEPNRGLWVAPGGKIEPGESPYVHQLPIPQADAIFFPDVTELSQPLYHAKYVYDADLNLVQVLEHPA